MEINVIATSSENNQLNTHDMILLGGKYGGTCYAAEGYETIKAQPEEKALKRAQMTAGNGHHSVFGHSMITLEIKNCPKIIAMLLNSIGVSNTSEKSARYTKMVPETELEATLYEKWAQLFSDRIHDVYPNMFTEKEVSKLAYENARYLISVFTPTSMVYSVPFRNLFYIRDFARSMYHNLNGMTGSFNTRLRDELKKLVDQVNELLGDQSDFICDNKSEYFRFMPVQATGEMYKPKEYYGEVYTTRYYASFACVAQEQRHRTVRVRINCSGTNPREFGIYVPEIIRGTEYQILWQNHFEELAEAGIWPQGTLVEVVEQGLLEDHVLKCKERMCGRAQLEVMRVNENITKHFICSDDLEEAGIKILEKIADEDNILTRCEYEGFKCKEGCKWGRMQRLRFI